MGKRDAFVFTDMQVVRCLQRCRHTAVLETRVGGGGGRHVLNVDVWRLSLDTIPAIITHITHT